MTTKEKILRHLQSGHPISTIEAAHEYGTMSLPFHIWALRQEGYPIRTRLKTTFKGRRYAEYELVADA